MFFLGIIHIWLVFYPLSHFGFESIFGTNSQWNQCLQCCDTLIELKNADLKALNALQVS